MLGATSIEKITKISASGRNFLDPSPSLFEKGPTNENVGILYLIVIINFVFFKISNPPYFTRKLNLTNFHNHGGPLEGAFPHMYNINKSVIVRSILRKKSKISNNVLNKNHNQKSTRWDY